jgi:Predicted enzyme related to lactoylglutathione lyase
MGRLKDIVIDADHPASLARFWAAALDGYDIVPYDDAEIARLAKLGLTPETDTSVMVAGPGTRICVHLRRGPRPERNRVHLDIAAEDVEAEVSRLIDLGATRVRDGDGYVVLHDPEGNNFCVCQG